MQILLLDEFISAVNMTIIMAIIHCLGFTQTPFGNWIKLILITGPVIETSLFWGA
jgi:uncharacterized membrane protein YdbT with pleckstrin-like domain